MKLPTINNFQVESVAKYLAFVPSLPSVKKPGVLVGIVFGFYMGYNWKNKIMRKKWD